MCAAFACYLNSCQSVIYTLKESFGNKPERKHVLFLLIILLFEIYIRIW